MLRLVQGLLLFCAVAPSQTLWKVSCHGGSGIHFTSVQAAVTAASPGDTILVIDNGACPSPLTPLAAPTIDKAVNLVGVIVPFPSPGAPPFPSQMTGTLVVQNIPIGQRVCIANIGPGGLGGGLRVVNCAGEVVVDSLIVWGTWTFPFSLDVIDCANVTFNHCEMNFSSQPLRVINSTVRMSWTRMGNFFPPPSPSIPRHPAIYLENSLLTVTGGSSIRGADEFVFPLGAGVSPGRPGMHLNNSTVNIGPATRVRAGTGGSGSWWDVNLASPSTVRVDSRALSIFSLFPYTTVDQPVTYTYPVVANQDMTMLVAGPVDGFALQMVSSLPFGASPTPFGPLLLDPASTLMLDIVHLPPSTNGFAYSTYFVPSSAQNGFGYVAQSLTLSPSGQLGFTDPIPFTVHWEHGHMP